MVQKGMGSQSKNYQVELRIDIEELEEALNRADEERMNAEWKHKN